MGDELNEWKLQKELTARWAEEGIDLAGEHLSLVAWEVMLPSWHINDAHGRWVNRPSTSSPATRTAVLWPSNSSAASLAHETPKKHSCR